MVMLEVTKVLHCYSTAIATAFSKQKLKLGKKGNYFFLNFPQRAHRTNSPATKFELGHHVGQ